MLLGDILHSEVVDTEFEAANKYEAIDKLIDLLVKSKEVPGDLRDHLREAVEDRERSLSTGMEHGVALPHGASDRVHEIKAALALSPRGVPFETLDGEPARLILLVVLPRRDFQGHVRTLAGIAHLLNSAAFRDRLMAARSADEVLELIHTEERRDIPLDGPH